MKSSGPLRLKGSRTSCAEQSVESGFPGHGKVQKDIWLWGVVIILAVVYLSSLSPGHVFANDDFAAYIMHGANLVEGRPYASIRYVPNPRALWLSPTNGYPPVYPLMLAPVYKVWGVNLEAFKIITIACFVGFLVIFVRVYPPNAPRLDDSLRTPGPRLQFRFLESAELYSLRVSILDVLFRRTSRHSARVRAPICGELEAWRWLAAFGTTLLRVWDTNDWNRFGSGSCTGGSF
jgi:hypothetical protein